jgi:hypothetical protein
MLCSEEKLLEIESSDKYTDLGNLPSQFFPYTGHYLQKPLQFHKVWIRPFNVQILRMISKAAVLSNMDMMVRAIDLTISVPARELTIGDFYFIMMWHRIHSVTKTPLIVSWDCEAPVYRNRETTEILFNDATFKLPELAEQNLYSVEKCGASNSELIHNSNIDIITLEDDFQPLDSLFDFPRAKHLQDIREMTADPELAFILPAAQWIKGEKMEDKLKVLDDMDDLNLFAKASLLNDTATHGVSETMKLKCRNCRKEHPYKATLEPFSFFL